MLEIITMTLTAALGCAIWAGVTLLYNKLNNTKRKKENVGKVYRGATKKNCHEK